ncbi:MAG TPA: hypothetical protein VEX66_15025 [Microlunatus sp.]|nr:hypothetical protein [Microlunatus sp.]
MPKEGETMYDEIRLDDVSTDQMATAEKFLTRNGIQGFNGDTGSLQGECFKAEYRYDRDASTLTVIPAELPEAFRTLPGDAVSPAFRALATSILSRRLGDYGVYDYVTPTIDNQSKGVLDFSTTDPTNGTIAITTNRYEVGTKAEAFQAKSTKLSGVGVGGTCTYTLAGAQTTLVITYFLNTIFTHTFTVGLQGINASRYATTTTGTDPYSSGYTYLQPTITITKN